MDSIYGNEQKEREKELLSSEQAAMLASVQNATPPLVLNVSHWNSFSPWRVPQRKVSDNLMLFIETGAFSITLRNQNLQLSAGESLLIPENTFHSYELAPESKKSSYYLLHLLRLPNDLLSVFPDSPRRLHHPEAFFEHLRLAVALRNTHSGHSEAYVCELLRQLVRECIADQDYRTVKTEAADHRIQQILEFIKNNCTANISVNDIAAAIGLKEVQCRRIFQKATGISPIEYLNRLRLLYAMRLLICSDSSISEIAEAAGFNSSSYFCRAFRKFYKKTPEEQRRLYR